MHRNRPLPDDPPRGRSIHPKLTETDMTRTTPEQNKALVLEAFETLFNKRDYAAAERFWSDRPYRARPRGTVRPHPLGSGNAALRESPDHGRRRLRHRR